MGWWKIQGTDDLVGDDVFNMLRQAAIDVAGEYLREFGRLPTRFEWQHLVQDALEPIGDLHSSRRDSLFAEQARPREVQIVLEKIEAP